MESKSEANQPNLELPVRPPFYQSSWFIILMMFCCCFPIGLFLMWKYKKFNKPVRIILTAFFAIMLIIGITTGGSSTSKSNSASTVESSASSKEATTKEETKAEETAIEETTAEETTVEETTMAVESEEEFKASCQEIGYKTILRNPDEYLGQRIVITAKIQQILQGGIFDNGQYYRLQTDNEGYKLYLDDEYFMYDCRPEGSTKLLQDDVIKVYAEFSGTEEIKRVLTGTKEEIPSIKAYYIDLISE